jgi:hypothetical protein
MKKNGGSQPSATLGVSLAQPAGQSHLLVPPFGFLTVPLTLGVGPSHPRGRLQGLGRRNPHVEDAAGEEGLVEPVGSGALAELAGGHAVLPLEQVIVVAQAVEPGFAADVDDLLKGVST